MLPPGCDDAGAVWMSRLCEHWHPTAAQVSRGSVFSSKIQLCRAPVSLGALLMCRCKVEAFLKMCFMGKCFRGSLEMGTGPESRCVYGGLTTAQRARYEVPSLCVSQTHPSWGAVDLWVLCSPPLRKPLPLVRVWPLWICWRPVFSSP